MTGTSRCGEPVRGCVVAGPADAVRPATCSGFRVVALALGATALLVALATARPAASQVCSWGGSPSLPPPDVEPLRSIADTLRAPGRVAVAPVGRVYTTDPSAGMVVETDAHGTPVSTLSELSDPYAIAVDSFGVVYVGELGAGRVIRYDDGWQPSGSLGQGPGEFVVPTDIATDPDPGLGYVYVTDGGAHQLRIYAPDGSLLRAVGDRGTAAGQFDFPAGVWVSAAGEVFVADQNNDRVQVFSRDGTFLRCFGNQEDGDRVFGRIQGMTGDSLGRIYVADTFQGQVRVFDAQGVEISAIGSFGSRPGQLRTPAGVAIDDNSRLFVASVNNGRVEVFGIDDFADPPPGDGIFSDGFDSGDSHAWSSTNP